MFRPKDWVVGGNPKIDGVQYHNHDDEDSYEAGADAMLEALRGNTISVLSFRWSADASDWADRHKGHLVFIPDEVVDAAE